MEINELVGQDWLVGMFGIVISIYLFLLTLPIIFTHNMLQEEMRELYTKYFMDNELKVYHKFTYTIIYFFLLLGTHITLYIINFEFTGPSLKWALVIYDIVITTSMIIYIIFILRNIKNLIYKNPYTNKNIVEKLFIVLLNEFDTKKIANQFILSEIIATYKTTNSPAIRELIVERIGDTTKYIINNSKVEYHGQSLKNIFDYCLREIALSSQEEPSRIQYQFIDVIEIYISAKKFSESQDDYYVINFIILILRNSIHNENWQITTLALDQLHRLPYNFCELIELYEKLFICNKLDIIVQEINHITSQTNEYTDNQYYALLAYISMINSSSLEHKIFAKSLLKKIGFKTSELQEWIHRTIIHFRIISKLNVANNLQLLIIDLQNSP